MLTAYRELKNEEVDTTELDVHLEQCASCRQELARYMLIGEQVRSLPVLEPPPEMHGQLMHALATEHMQLLQRSAPGTVPTPEFLKPYLREHAQATHQSNPFSAFSTAETGPLPVIRAKRKSRPRSQMSHFAVLGLAAMFLMVVMMGGITSLLLLSHNNLQQIITTGAAVSQLTEVQQVKYTTATSYQHVVSAVADRANIYYTAYSSDGTNTSWMLEQLNRRTQISTPLLATPSPGPLIVLGSSQQWLVWLQFDQPQTKSGRNLPNHSQHSPVMPWSLQYLPLGQQGALDIAATPQTLVKGTVDQDTAPAWVNTPVQGIWFVQDRLLVALTDNKGISHLVSYQLGATGKQAFIVIATAEPGHVYTSPTANSDSSQIYWSEEWMSSDGTLKSNIWTQQVVATPRPLRGLWTGHTVELTVKQLFLADGMSFHPQIADDTLFWLSTPALTTSAQGTPTPGSTPASTPQPATSTTARIDTNIFAAPADAAIRGMVTMLPINGDPTLQPTIITGSASALQVGTDFALWQADKGYKMYDVQTGSDVSVGHILDEAGFLAVNGDTAVWVENTTNTSANTSSSGVSPRVIILAFNWPK